MKARGCSHLSLPRRPRERSWSSEPPRKSGPFGNASKAPSRCGGRSAGRSRHVARGWFDSHAPQREAIRVPAGADRGIGAQATAGVISAGGLGECELRLAQTELPETQRTDQRRAPPTVRWIVVVADPPCVVQDREEQDHDLVTPRGRLCEVETDRGNLAPVVFTVERRGKGGRDRPDPSEDLFDVEERACVQSIPAAGDRRRRRLISRGPDRSPPAQGFLPKATRRSLPARRRAASWH